MRRAVEQIHQFMTTFGQQTQALPNLPSRAIKNLRKKLVLEEAGEFADAVDAGDLVAIADAIGDLLYVVLGSAIAYGIDPEPIFEEVYRSNMTKKWPDGTVHRDEGGKVIKPSTYSPPNLGPIIERLKDGGVYEGQGIWTKGRLTLID